MSDVIDAHPEVNKSPLNLAALVDVNVETHFSDLVVIELSSICEVDGVHGGMKARDIGPHLTFICDNSLNALL